MIVIDWGTSNFRATRLRDGQLIDRICTGPALLAIPPGGFPDALRAALSAWLADGEHNILMAGMVGSRQGWVEAPYLPCPVDLATLANATIPVHFKGADIRLVPGLSADDSAGTPEVMRGEEVQLLGADTGPDALVCLPGTHSKWARIEQSRITGFTTHMTGELFATLRAHTILGRLMTEPADNPDAFNAGIDRAANPGGLLHHLFGVRTLGLFDRLPPAAAAAYLSGLLIGHEITAVAPTQPVHLVGAPALCALYAAALARRGLATHTVPGDPATIGLACIGKHLGWT